MSEALVVLPTYNEADNIIPMVKCLLKFPLLTICIVDDNSPDGTSEKIKKFILSLGSNFQNRVHLIVRKEKDGRGGAVRKGFEWGIQRNQFSKFIEMDSDFSHSPEDLPKGLELLNDFDVVLGSRYPDGEIRGWPLKRKMFSFFANLLIRILISSHISDYTNGFRFYNREAAKFILSMPQKHKGYIYLSETLSYFLKAKKTIGAFPILFVNRERGVSNTNFPEIKSALLGIFKIAWNYRFK